MLSVADLYAEAGITVFHTIAWGADVPSAASGVYVIEIENMDAIKFVAPFEEKEAGRWKDDEAIIYIGRATNLRRRLSQFRRHIYGRKAPHAGGQAILLLKCPKLIHWTEATDFQGAEDRLLKAFEVHAHRKPFGNRMRSAKLAAKPQSFSS